MVVSQILDKPALEIDAPHLVFPSSYDPREREDERPDFFLM